jgi:hypothetical protein
MPSTDSDTPKKVDAIPSELVVGMARNRWTASIGINGRHGLDYALTEEVAPAHPWDGSRNHRPRVEDERAADVPRAAVVAAGDSVEDVEK